jgi:hypothetical protein
MCDMCSWIDYIENLEGGIAMLSNLLYDYVNERLCPDIFWDFFEQLDKLLAQSLKQSGALYQATSDQQYLCRGQLISEIPRLSKVQDASSFAKRHIDETKTTFSILPIPLTVEQWKILEESDSSEFGKGIIKTGREFAWVTKTDELNVVPDEDGKATVIRNRLGLCLIKDDEGLEIKIDGRYSNDYLIQIDYPSDIDFEIFTPTFIEGSNFTKIEGSFLSKWSFYRSKQLSSDPEWGETVSLDLNEGGFPEAVHRPVPFSENLRFKIKSLGIVSPFSSSPTKTSFLNVFPQQWNITTSKEDFFSRYCA